jgi:hypothetical protein
MQRPLKRNVAIGAAALATVAGAGGAYAATQDSGASARQAYLNDVAKRLNVSPKQLTAALQGAALDQLAAAVKAGRLSQARADAIKRKIEQGPAGAPLFFGEPRRPGAFGLAGGARSRAAAGYLGLTDAQLFDQLASGKSLAQIAKARGKSVAGLKQAMTTAIRVRLDQAVARGAITRAQEQQLLSRLQARLDAQINRSMPGLRRGYPGGLGPRWKLTPPDGAGPGVPPPGLAGPTPLPPGPMPLHKGPPPLPEGPPPAGLGG